MRLFFLSFITLFISLSNNAFSQHSIYIGPDIYYRDYKEIVTSPAKSNEYGCLYGFQIGYDYIKSSHYYFGTDLRYSTGTTVYDGSLQNYISNQITPYKSTTLNDFLNFEVRCGKTYQLKRCIIIPYFGLGYFSWFRGCSPNDPYGYDEYYSWRYTALGLRSIYKINYKWSFGLNIKFMLMTHATMISSDLEKITFQLGNKLQTELEVPLNYTFNKSFIFFDQISWVPYYRSQNIGESNVQSVRLSNNRLLNFVEPSSSTNIVGIRLEFRKNF